MASVKQINKSKWKGEDLFKNRWFCFSCSLQPLWGRRGRGVPLTEEFRQREKATNAGMSLYFHQSTALTCTLTTAINCLPVPTVSTLSLHSQFNEKVLPLPFLTVQLICKVLYPVSQSRCSNTCRAHSEHRVWMLPLHTPAVPAAVGQAVHISDCTVEILLMVIPQVSGLLLGCTLWKGILSPWSGWTPAPLPGTALQTLFKCFYYVCLRVA